MYAALFNLEGMVNQIIADTESRYKCSAENAAALTADIKQEDKPKILWAQYIQYANRWSLGSSVNMPNIAVPKSSTVLRAWDLANNMEAPLSIGT